MVTSSYYSFRFLSDEKSEIIKKTYYDRAGYGSIQKAYQDAKNRDNTITLENVRNWFYQNVENKKNLQDTIHLLQMSHILNTKQILHSLEASMVLLVQ